MVPAIPSIATRPEDDGICSSRGCQNLHHQAAVKLTCSLQSQLPQICYRKSPTLTNVDFEVRRQESERRAKLARALTRHALGCRKERNSMTFMGRPSSSLVDAVPRAIRLTQYQGQGDKFMKKCEHAFR